LSFAIAGIEAWRKEARTRALPAHDRPVADGKLARSGRHEPALTATARDGLARAGVALRGHGAVCTLGDIIGEWLVFAFGWTLLGEKLYAEPSPAGGCGAAVLPRGHRREVTHYRPMSVLTLFGLFAVTAMLAFYALEERDPRYLLGFAAACVLGSIYGFLQGAWPFGIVEAVWAAVAVRRWRIRLRRQS
jgi:hypothetical protein